MIGLVFVAFLIGTILWALYMLDRIRTEQRQLVAAVAALHVKLDRLAPGIGETNARLN